MGITNKADYSVITGNDINRMYIQHTLNESKYEDELIFKIKEDAEISYNRELYYLKKTYYSENEKGYKVKESDRIRVSLNKHISFDENSGSVEIIKKSENFILKLLKIDTYLQENKKTIF